MFHIHHYTYSINHLLFDKKIHSHKDQKNYVYVLCLFLILYQQKLSLKNLVDWVSYLLYFDLINFLKIFYCLQKNFQKDYNLRLI